jgi:poly-gamma-glutamate system protein
MFVPSAKSKFSLVVLLVVSLLLFIWVNTSRTFVKEKYHDQKLAAAHLMQDAMDVVKEYRSAQNVYIDDQNDPGRTGLIGDKETLITTDRGSLTAKLTSLNPNMAAAVVDMFKQAKLKKGDNVAVSCTGSLPAVTMAVYSAATVLELDLTVITSVGASMFGANDPDFTWLDMERLFNEKGIFSYRSVAASLGGGRDLGRGLNLAGRDLIEEAIARNEVELVKELSLEKNIERKMAIYIQQADTPYKLYVNIGGGLSSLGNSINGRLVSPGFHRYLSAKNIPLQGTMFLFAEQGVGVMHLLDILKIAQNYDLPTAPDPIPEPGTGRMFVDERYNVTIAGVALAILILLIFLVIFFDHKQLKLKEEEINI